MRLGSLCSGIGGLELGVERALGARTVWQAEIDPAPSAVLAERWPKVPNIGDIRDTAAMTPVDVLTAGYPCQPFSTAGRRKGEDDPRHLWPAVRAAVAHLGPGLVVLENVRGHLTLGFDRVLGDLADIGYDAEWRVVRASDVGCCHRRDRLFVVAYPQGAERRAPQPDRMAAAPRRAPEPRERRGPDAWGIYASAVHRWGQHHGPAPDPTTDGRLSPRFVEWMQGFPPGWVTDVLHNRNAALRCLGNAVVPQVAEAFLRSWAYGDTGQPASAADRLLPTPEASDGTGGRRARNLRWDGDTAYRPSGHKASVSLREALDRIDKDDAA